jgi:hypothetical protein
MDWLRHARHFLLVFGFAVEDHIFSILHIKQWVRIRSDELRFAVRLAPDFPAGNYVYQREFGDFMGHIVRLDFKLLFLSEYKVVLGAFDVLVDLWNPALFGKLWVFIDKSAVHK